MCVHCRFPLSKESIHVILESSVKISDRLDDYLFRISEMCCRVFVTGDKFGHHRRHGIEVQSRNNRKRCIDLNHPEMCVERPCVQPCSCHGGKPDM